MAIFNVVESPDSVTRGRIYRMCNALHSYWHYTSFKPEKDEE